MRMKLGPLATALVLLIGTAFADPFTGRYNVLSIAKDGVSVSGFIDFDSAPMGTTTFSLGSGFATAFSLMYSGTGITTVTYDQIVPGNVVDPIIFDAPLGSDELLPLLPAAGASRSRWDAFVTGGRIQLTLFSGGGTSWTGISGGTAVFLGSFPFGGPPGGSGMETREGVACPGAGHAIADGNGYGGRIGLAAEAKRVVSTAPATPESGPAPTLRVIRASRPRRQAVPCRTGFHGLAPLHQRIHHRRVG